jgi:hypothetical protein
MNPSQQIEENAKKRPHKKCRLTMMQKMSGGGCHIWRATKSLRGNKIEYYRRTALELENAIQIFALGTSF